MFFSTFRGDGTFLKREGIKKGKNDFEGEG